MRMKIAKLDPGRFASMSVPEAAPEQLLTMAKLIAWVLGPPPCYS